MPDMTLGVLCFVCLLAYWLAIIIPNIAITVRRLHDQNKSGSYYFISFIPYIGGVILLVFMCLPHVDGWEKRANLADINNIVPPDSTYKPADPLQAEIDELRKQIEKRKAEQELEKLKKELDDMD